MKIAAQFKNAVTEENLPDAWDSSIGPLKVDDMFVVSRKKDGSVLSRFGNDMWDMSPYASTGKLTLSFTSWSHEPHTDLSKAVAVDLKRIMFGLIYLSQKCRSMTTLRAQFLSCRWFAVLFYSQECRLYDPSVNLSLFHAFSVSFSRKSKTEAIRMLTTLRGIFLIEGQHPEFKYAFSASQMEQLEAIYEKIPDGLREQTPLIPTRIYANLISGLDRFLVDYVAHSERITKFYRRSAANPYYGVSSPTRYMNGYSPTDGRVSYKEAVEQLNLTHLFQSYGLKATNKQNLQSYLALVQMASKLLIHIFTGMRNNEANFLPLDTYTCVEVDGAVINVFRGYTSKLSGQNQVASYWITCDAVEAAVKATQSLAEIACIMKGLDNSDPSHFPLFVSMASKSKEPNNEHYDIPLSGIGTSHIRKLLGLIGEMEIREEDVQELEYFDGFRNWRSDVKFSIGKPWPFATHQARLSLVVYAARSGMVSLPSLGLQLKHITQEMISWYANNAAFAKNFIESDDQQHLIDEFNAERRISQFLRYEDDVINTTSKLWGGEGNRVQVAKDRNKLPEFLGDRKETMRRFNKGEMAYNETLFGGCTNTDGCDKIAFTAITNCIDCSFAVNDERSEKKMRRAVEHMESAKDQYDKESPFYKQMELEIAALNQALERISN